MSSISNNQIVYLCSACLLLFKRMINADLFVYISVSQALIFCAIASGYFLL